MENEVTHYLRREQDAIDPNMYRLDIACKMYGYGGRGITNKEKVDCPICLEIIVKEK